MSDQARMGRKQADGGVTEPRLHVLQVVRPAAGGMRRHVEQLCRGLPAVGIECSIAAPADMMRDFAGLAQYHALAIAPGIHPLRDLAAARRLAAIAPAYDLLHCHGLRAAWVGALASRLGPITPVVTLHNMPPTRHLPSRWAVRFAVSRAAALIVVSQAIANELQHARVVRPDRIRVIPNGVTIPERCGRDAARQALGLPADEPVLLAVGRLEREKGFDILLEAAAQLAGRAAFRLCIVGEGSLRASLQESIRAYGLGDRAVLPGFRTDLDLWYEAADVVVVPSRTEGQGLVALEAMAHERPVVATHVGGLPEVVLPMETGLLVPPEDPAALADATEHLLRDAALRAQMGRAGQQRVEQQFSLAAMLQKVAEVYRATHGQQTAGPAK